MKKLTLAAATLMALTGACPGSMASVRIPQAPPVQSPDCTLWVKSTPSLFAQASEAYASPLRLANRAPQRFEIPFHDEFDDGDATRANYTVVDVDNDGYGDGNSVKNRWFWKEDETLIQFCTDNEAPGNDWLFTPPIHLDGLNIYQLEIIVNMGAASNLRVTVGTSTDPADHREILDLKGIDENWMTSYKADFPVPEEGDYYIGLYNYSGSDSFYFNLFSIDIKAGISSQIPMAPSDLTVTPAAEGALEASLKFTAPATLANGSPITGQTDITVLRNGTVADTFKAEPGAETSWTDKTPDQGENKYTVFATHNGKEGMTAEVTAWVGTDIPGAITLTDIHTTSRNMEVVLEWTPVTEGRHPGAHFVPEEVTYTVYRGNKSNSMEPVAEGLKTTTYTDTQVKDELGDTQSSRFYAVKAVNKAGESSSGAEIVAVGKPYTLPQSESFANGQFNIQPWLTDPISGSFSWECMRNDTQRGMSAQDNDNGLSIFYAAWGGDTDSRLKTPVFDIAGSNRPMISLYMFHWQDYTVEADNGATRLLVEISRDGGEFEPLSDAIPAGYSQYGWVEHRFRLDDYKDAETVQFGFRGQTDNSWMYFYIDNIRFEEQQPYDLAIEQFYGGGEVNIGDMTSFSVTYLNRGTENAEGYNLVLYRDGEAVETVAGELLEPGKTLTHVFKIGTNADNVNRDNRYYVEIEYAADTNTANNTSSEIASPVKKSFYPTVKNLAGESADGTVTLTWDAPVLPAPGTTVTDGAEEYAPFEIDSFGQWISHDGDERLSGYYTDLPEWPNRGVNQAFMVWTPYELDGFDFEEYASLIPYEGNACFICWLANLSDWWSDPQNDDYLISPEVAPGSTLSFMIKGISNEPNEDYEIMYSATGKSPSDFTSLRQAKATSEWTSEEISLPDDARYFCIRYTGSWQMGVMVDNIVYEPVNSVLELKGYDIFRNGVKLNDGLLQSTTFTDNAALEGDNTYSVAAVYDRGTSNACRGISVATSGISTPGAHGLGISTRNGMLSLTATQPTAVTVYRVDGTTALQATVDGQESYSLPRGVYLVNASGYTVKVVL